MAKPFVPGKPFIPYDIFYKHTEPLRKRLSSLHEQSQVDVGSVFSLVYSRWPNPEKSQELADILHEAIRTSSFNKEEIISDLLERASSAEGEVAHRLKSAAHYLSMSKGNMTSLLSVGYLGFDLDIRSEGERAIEPSQAFYGLAGLYGYADAPPTTRKALRTGTRRFGRALFPRRPTRELSLDMPIRGKEGEEYATLGDYVTSVTTDPEQLMILKEEAERLAEIGAVEGRQETASTILEILTNDLESEKKPLLQTKQTPTYRLSKIQRGIQRMGKEERIYLPIARKETSGADEFAWLTSGAYRESFTYQGYYIPTQTGKTKLQQLSLSKTEASQITRVLEMLGENIYGQDTLSDLRDALIRYNYLDPSNPPEFGSIVKAAREFAPSAFKEEGWTFLEELERAHVEAQQRYSLAQALGERPTYSIFRKDKTIGYGEIVNAKVKAVRSVALDYEASFPIGDDRPEDTSRTRELEEARMYDRTFWAPASMSVSEIYSRVAFAKDRYYIAQEPIPESVPDFYTFQGYAAASYYLLTSGNSGNIPKLSDVYRLAQFLRKDKSLERVENVSAEDYEFLKEIIRTNRGIIAEALDPAEREGFGKFVDLLEGGLPDEKYRIATYERMRNYLNKYATDLFNRSESELASLGFNVDKSIYIHETGGVSPLPVTSIVGEALGRSGQGFRLVPVDYNEKTDEVLYTVIETENDLDIFPTSTQGVASPPIAQKPFLAEYIVENPPPPKDRFSEALNLAMAPEAPVVQQELMEMGIKGDYYVAKNIAKYARSIIEAPEELRLERVKSLRKISPVESSVISKFIRKELSYTLSEYKRKYGDLSDKDKARLDVVSNLEDFQNYINLFARIKSTFGVDIEQLAETFNLRQELLRGNDPGRLGMIAEFIQMAGKTLTRAPRHISEEFYRFQKARLEQEYQNLQNIVQPGQVLLSFDIESKPVGEFKESDPSAWYITEIGWAKARYLGEGRYEGLQTGYMKIEAEPTYKLADVFSEIAAMGKEDEIKAILGEKWMEASTPDIVREAARLGSVAAKDILAAYQRGLDIFEQSMAEAGEYDIFTGYNILGYDIGVIESAYQATAPQPGEPGYAEHAQKLAKARSLREGAIDVMRFMQQNLGIGEEHLPLESVAQRVEREARNLFSGKTAKGIMQLISGKLKTIGQKHDPTYDTRATLGVLFHFIESFKERAADELELLQRRMALNIPTEEQPRAGKPQSQKLTKDDRERLRIVKRELKEREKREIKAEREARKKIGGQLKGVEQIRNPKPIPRSPEKVMGVINPDVSTPTYAEVRARGEAADAALGQRRFDYSFLSREVKYRPGEEKLINLSIDTFERLYRSAKRLNLGEDEIGNWVAYHFATGYKTRDYLEERYTTQNLSRVLGSLHKIARARVEKQDIIQKLQERYGVSAEEAEKMFAFREHYFRHRIAATPYFYGSKRYEGEPFVMREEDIPRLKEEDTEALLIDLEIAEQQAAEETQSQLASGANLTPIAPSVRSKLERRARRDESPARALRESRLRERLSFFGQKADEGEPSVPSPEEPVATADIIQRRPSVRSKLERRARRDESPARALRESGLRERLGFFGKADDGELSVLSPEDPTVAADVIQRRPSVRSKLERRAKHAESRARALRSNRTRELLSRTAVEQPSTIQGEHPEPQEPVASPISAPEAAESTTSGKSGRTRRSSGRRRRASEETTREEQIEAQVPVDEIQGAIREIMQPASEVQEEPGPSSGVSGVPSDQAELPPAQTAAQSGPSIAEPIQQQPASPPASLLPPPATPPPASPPPPPAAPPPASPPPPPPAAPPPPATPPPAAPPPPATPPPASPPPPPPPPPGAPPPPPPSEPPAAEPSQPPEEEQPQRDTTPQAPHEQEPSQPVARYSARRFIDRYIGRVSRGEPGTHIRMGAILVGEPRREILRHYQPGPEFGEAFVEYGPDNQVSDFGFRGLRTIAESKVSAVTGKGQMTSALDVATEAFETALRTEHFSDDPLYFQTELRKRVSGKIAEIADKMLKSLETADVTDKDKEREIISGIQKMAAEISEKFINAMLADADRQEHLGALREAGYEKGIFGRATTSQNISNVYALQKALEKDETLARNFIREFGVINEQTLQEAIDTGSKIMMGSGGLLYNVGKYASADYLDLWGERREAGEGGGGGGLGGSFWRNPGIRMMYALYYAKMMYKDIFGERLQQAQQYGSAMEVYAPVGSMYGGLGPAGYSARTESYAAAFGRASYENLGGFVDVFGRTMERAPALNRILNAIGIAGTSMIGGQVAAGVLGNLAAMAGPAAGALSGIAAAMPYIGLAVGATVLGTVGINEAYNLVTGERKSITERLHEAEQRAQRNRIAARLAEERGYIPIISQAGLSGFVDRSGKFIKADEAFTEEELLQAAKPDEMGGLLLAGPGVELEKRYERAATNVQEATGYSEKQVGAVLARYGAKYYRGQTDWLTEEREKQLINVFRQLSSRGYGAETLLQLGDLARRYGYAMTDEEVNRFILSYEKEPFDIEAFERENQGYVAAGGFIGQFLQQPWQGAYWARQMGMQTQAQASFIVPYLSQLTQLGYKAEDYQPQIEQLYKRLGPSAQYYAPVFGALTVYGGYTPEAAFGYINRLPQITPYAGTMLGRMIGGDLSAISYTASTVAAGASNPIQAYLAGGFRFLDATGQPIYQTSLQGFRNLVSAQALYGNPIAQGGLPGLNQLIREMPAEDRAAWMSGGAMAREWLHIRRQFDFQMQGYALQQRGINLQRSYFIASNNLEDQMRALQYQSQMADFSAQYERLGIERRHFAEDMALRWKRLMLGRREELDMRSIASQRKDLTHQYQLWQLEFEKEGMELSRTWTRQAWQRRDTMQFLQHGWEMEDLELGISRSFGFERRQLQKQKERQAVMFALQRQDVQAERGVQEEVWKREEEAYEKKKEYILAMMKLEDEEFEKRKKYSDELFKLSVKEFETRKRQQEELFDFQKKQIDRQKEEYIKSYKLQEQMIKLQRDYQDKQLKLQQDQLNLSIQQTKETHNYQVQLKTVADLYSQITGYFSEMMRNNPTKFLSNMVMLVSDMSKMDVNKLEKLRQVINEVAWIKTD